MRWRALTAGERRMSDMVFGSALNCDQVRLFSLPVWTRPFVPGAGLVVWPARSALADFSMAPLALRAVLIHELVHVWQAQSGVFLPLAKLKAGDGPAAYVYDLTDGRSFTSLNIEQQAMVVQHAYQARNGGPAPFQTAAYSRILDTWPHGQA